MSTNLSTIEVDNRSAEAEGQAEPMTEPLERAEEQADPDDEGPVAPSLARGVEVIAAALLGIS